MTQFYKLFNGGCGCAKCEADDEQAADTKIVNDYDTKIVNDYEGDDDEEMENGGYRAAMSAMRNSRLASLSESALVTKDDPNSLEGLAKVGEEIKERKMWKDSHSVSNSVGSLFNSQPCGDSHIPDGHQCRVGQGAAPQESSKQIARIDAVILGDGAKYVKFNGQIVEIHASSSRIDRLRDGDKRAVIISEKTHPKYGKYLSADLPPPRRYSNSQPCGDSHIPDGHQCRVGDGSRPTYQSEPKTTPNSDTDQKHEERYIATTIIDQIKATDRSAIMAWGTRNLTIMPAGSTPDGGYQRGGVQFKVNGGKLGHGIVKVRLMANDTYMVETGKVRMGQWKPQGKRDDVYADNLMETIDHMVERDRPGYANRYHDALEAMVNAGAGGQPCGDSHIAAGLTCRLSKTQKALVERSGRETFTAKKYGAGHVLAAGRAEPNEARKLPELFLHVESLEGVGEVFKVLNKDREKIANAGTSEGVRKSWETRRNGDGVHHLSLGGDDIDTDPVEAALPANASSFKRFLSVDERRRYDRAVTGEPTERGEIESDKMTEIAFRRMRQFYEQGKKARDIAPVAAPPTASPGPSAVQVGTAAEQAAMDARVRSPQFRKMIERRRIAGKKWQEKHENRSVTEPLETIVNAGAGGQPCGDSHIAAGLTCRVGESATPASVDDAVFKRRAVKVHFDSGDSFATEINGTKEDVEKHYLGRPFERSNEKLHKVVKVEHLPVQVGTAEERAAMDARVRSPQFRKMIERRRIAGEKWQKKHE